MDEDRLAEELVEKGLTRRDLLKRTAGVGLGISALGLLEIQPALGQGLTKVKWVSPRGTRWRSSDERDPKRASRRDPQLRRGARAS